MLMMRSLLNPTEHTFRDLEVTVPYPSWLCRGGFADTRNRLLFVTPFICFDLP